MKTCEQKMLFAGAMQGTGIFAADVAVDALRLAAKWFWRAKQWIEPTPHSNGSASTRRAGAVMDDRARSLAMAMWPHGFWCEACGHRASAVSVCRHTSGWKGVCPACRTEISLCNASTVALTKDENVIRLVGVACVLHAVPLHRILTKSIRDLRTVQARRAVIRLLCRELPRQQVSEILGVSRFCVREATERRNYQDVWTVAADARRKEKENERRRAAKSAYQRRWREVRRASEAGGTEVEARTPSGTDPTPDAGTVVS